GWKRRLLGRRDPGPDQPGVYRPPARVHTEAFQLLVRVPTPFRVARDDPERLADSVLDGVREASLSSARRRWSISWSGHRSSGVGELTQRSRGRNAQSDWHWRLARNAAPVWHHVAHGTAELLRPRPHP